jgi:rhamnose transport system substrate-binding protein/rhamnose transport system permease protein
MKKKLLIGFLITVMVLSTALLGACGSKETPPPADNGSTPATDADNDADADKGGDVTVAMLPKFKGENYFDAVKVGAEEAATELGITLLYDGPPQDQATNQKQVDILEGWIAQGVNVIAVSPNDPDAIAPTLKKAQAAGIKVITFDADAAPDARDLFVNQATNEAVAAGLIKGVADDLASKGYGADNPANLALLSSAKTDANQKAWQESIEAAIATPEYSFIKLNNKDKDVYFPGPDETKTTADAATIIGRMGEGPDKIQAAIGLTSMATPALGAQYAAAASKPDASKTSLTGLATPNALKEYVLDGENPLNSGVLWNCMDLGYLTIQVAYQLNDGTITPDSATIEAGRVGSKEIADKQVILGDALVFTAADIEQYNY